MRIEDAVASIIGKDLADAIINGQGIHWAIVAAMAEAKAFRDREAVECIRAYSKSLRENPHPPAHTQSGGGGS